MLIDKKISEYIVFETETIFRALEKINSNKKRIVFVVEGNGVLMGCLTDGDFRRWVTSSPNFDVNLCVSEVMNTDASFAVSSSELKDISSKFTSSIDILPIVDSSHKLVSIALKNEDGFSVGARVISDNNPVFIIAEIGNNHNGDLDLAKRLVDLALDAGADCVKFQMRPLSGFRCTVHYGFTCKVSIG